MFAGSLSEFVHVVSRTFFPVLHYATKVTQCPRKTIGKKPQCCWMPLSEETGALVLIFFLDVVGSVCHSRCVFLFSVQCSHRCGWFLTRGCSVKSVSHSFFCLERCLGTRVFGAKLEENRDSCLTSQQ